MVCFAWIQINATLPAGGWLKQDDLDNTLYASYARNKLFLAFVKNSRKSLR